MIIAVLYSDAYDFALAYLVPIANLSPPQKAVGLRHAEPPPIGAELAPERRKHAHEPGRPQFLAQG